MELLTWFVAQCQKCCKLDSGRELLLVSLTLVGLVCFLGWNLRLSSLSIGVIGCMTVFFIMFSWYIGSAFESSRAKLTSFLPSFKAPTNQSTLEQINPQGEKGNENLYSETRNSSEESNEDIHHSEITRHRRSANCGARNSKLRDLLIDVRSSPFKHLVEQEGIPQLENFAQKESKAKNRNRQTFEDPLNFGFIEDEPNPPSVYRSQLQEWSFAKPDPRLHVRRAHRTTHEVKNKEIADEIAQDAVYQTGI